MYKNDKTTLTSVFLTIFFLGDIVVLGEQGDIYRIFYVFKSETYHDVLSRSRVYPLRENTVGCIYISVPAH
jgi:hypothetical protein